MQRRQAQAHPKGRLFEGLSWLKWEMEGWPCSDRDSN
jgi:hypothetical protein